MLLCVERQIHLCLVHPPVSPTSGGMADSAEPRSPAEEAAAAAARRSAIGHSGSVANHATQAIMQCRRSDSERDRQMGGAAENTTTATVSSARRSGRGFLRLTRAPHPPWLCHAPCTDSSRTHSFHLLLVAGLACKHRRARTHGVAASVRSRPPAHLSDDGPAPGIATVALASRRRNQLQQLAIASSSAGRAHR